MLAQLFGIMQGERSISLAFTTPGLAQDLLRTGCVRPHLAKYTPESFANGRMRSLQVRAILQTFKDAEAESFAESLYIRLMISAIEKELARRIRKAVFGENC